jgi:hypothetical protein
MPFVPFEVAGLNQFLAEANPAGEKLVLRSTAAGDTQNVVITGTVGGNPDGETVALLGRREVVTTKVYTEVGSVTPASSLAGILSVMGTGRAGTGDIRVNNVPAAGSTLTVGLDGFGVTYTFVDPAHRIFEVPAASAFVQGDYFDVVWNNAAIRRFWFDIDGAGTNAPSNPGGLWKIEINSGDTADEVAAQVATEVGNGISGQLGVSFAVENRVYAFQPDLGVLSNFAFTDSTTGTVLVPISASAGTTLAANQILTTFDPGSNLLATENDIAYNISAAISASVGGGAVYSASLTTANPYVSATWPDATSVVLLEDKVPALRSLAWNIAATGLTVDVRPPAGGSDGALLASLDTTDTVSVPMSFDNEDLSAAPLLPGRTPTTVPIYAGGRVATLELAAANLANAVALRLESSLAGTVWRNRSADYPLTSLDDNVQHHLLEPAEYWRLVITTNANTAAAAVHAGLIVS